MLWCVDKLIRIKTWILFFLIIYTSLGIIIISSKAEVNKDNWACLKQEGSLFIAIFSFAIALEDSSRPFFRGLISFF